MAVTLRCLFWEDFARFSKDAETVIYEVNMLDSVFRVYAIKGNIFTYEEPLPLLEKAEIVKDRRGHGTKPHRDSSNLTKQSEFTIISRQVMRKTLKCGISYSVIPRLVKEGDRWIAEFEYKFEPSIVSEFLSHALGTLRDHIIEGSIAKIPM